VCVCGVEGMRFERDVELAFCLCLCAGADEVSLSALRHARIVDFVFGFEN